MLRVLFYGALGALAAYFFDPDSGRRRRALARDRVPAFLRQGGRKAEQMGRAASAETYGAAQKVKYRKEEEKPQPDDVTLARKVETEIFRDADVPKGQINVNAENGVVFLRGTVENREWIERLGAEAKNVDGVEAVRNLLHLPGTEAPVAPGVR
jgi:osmotically-inducible protein OsmY